MFDCDNMQLLFPFKTLYKYLTDNLFQNAKTFQQKNIRLLIRSKEIFRRRFPYQMKMSAFIRSHSIYLQ